MVPMDRPRIVVTLTNPSRARDAENAQDKNRRYLAAVERHGGAPVAIDDTATEPERREAFAAMDGLLISGGADLDPTLYGEAPSGATPHDPGRDALDAAAFSDAAARRLPILGICRGLQAINVFCGGRLVQHLDHHESPAYPARASEATRHLLRLAPDTRLAGILGGAGTLEVNSFHHQAVAPDGLAPGLRAAGLAPHAGGDLVEAFEAEDPDQWLIGVQCHPERVESSPEEMARLWDAFVAAAARSADLRIAAARNAGD
jgi:putative glutamine amidotransferase